MVDLTHPVVANAPELVPLLVPLLLAAAVMLNWLDWAYMVLRLSESLTKFTTKVPPTGHPELGGLTVVVPEAPSTRALRIWLFSGNTLRSCGRMSDGRQECGQCYLRCW